LWSCELNVNVVLFGLVGKCQYIPNGFVPVHPEQPRVTISRKPIHHEVFP
jgi:hypothetical protein